MWRLHFINLLGASWHSVLAALSTSTLAIILFSLAAPVATFFVTLGVVSKQNSEKTFVEHLKQSVIPTLIGFAVPLMLLVCVFGWKVVETVYGDHQALVAKANTPPPACPSCPICPIPKSCKGSVSPSQQPVSPAPETIHDLVAEVRLTCVLVNASTMPEDSPLAFGNGDSYLESAMGKAYLQSRAYSYKRTEEEGKVTAIENFKPVPNSDLIGRPVSALTDYSVLQIAAISVAGGHFSECVGAEVTLRVNGRDVLRSASQISVKMDAVHGLSFGVKLEGMNLPK
jgi:hypothetical protein